MLQQKLLQEEAPTLQRLVGIAKLWQSAESAQTAFGTAATEFVRQTTKENREEETEFHIRKASNYKKDIKEEWLNRQQSDA